MSDERPKKVLFVLLGAIGDVVRALPLAVRMKRHWPDCTIAWAVEPKSQGILQGHPDIDELIVFQRSEGFAAFRRFLSEVKQKRFDLVLDLQRHFKSGVVSFSSRARRRIGFHRRNSKEFNWLFNNEKIPFTQDSVLKILHYQRFGDLLELPQLDPLESNLGLNKAELYRAEDLYSDASRLAGFEAFPLATERVTFLIGGSWRSKLWPAERFARLAIDLKRELGLSSFLIGSPAEARIAENIMQSVEPGFVGNLVGRTTLREVAALISRSHVAVGGDSGPMHIAAAVGVPVVSLWGATTPFRNAPYGSESLILQSAIGCSPCLRRECPGLENLCMSDIPSYAVFARIQKLLQ